MTKQQLVARREVLKRELLNLAKEFASVRDRWRAINKELDEVEAKLAGPGPTVMKHKRAG